MQYLGRIGAGIMVLGFFLPWINILIIKFSGFDILKMMIGVAGEEGLSLPGYAYGIPLMLILPAYALASNKAPILRIAGVFPFIYLGVVVLMVASSLGGMPPMEMAGIGLWVTLLGGICAFVGSYKVDTPTNDEDISEGPADADLENPV